MKMIAKTIAGKEYMYNPKSAHAVSAAGAAQICQVLNEKRWRLNKPEEKWHIYDCGWYEQEYTEAGSQSFYRRRGVIGEKRRYNFAY
mgnify:CR=1 FL=1